MQIRRRKPAVANILGLIIGIALVASVGGVVYYMFYEQADIITTTSNLEIRNLNAIRTDNTLTVTANMRNMGTAVIGDVHLNEITVGSKFSIQDKIKTDCVLDVNDSLKGVFRVNSAVDLFVLKSTTDPTCTDGDLEEDSSSGVTPTGADVKNKIIRVITYDGFTIAEKKGVTPQAEPINGGSSKAFKLKIDSDHNIGTDTEVDSGNIIYKTVPISERLTLQLQYTIGNDTFLTDVYNTRVRPG